MVEMMEAMAGDASRVLVIVTSIMAVVFAIITWATTKAFMPAIIALLFGAIITASVAGFGGFQSRAEDDVTDWTDGPTTTQGR